MWSRIGRFVLTLSAITLMLPVWGRAQDFRGTHLTGASLSYPMPPFSYEGSRAVTVTFRTRPDVLRALVPEPLVPNAAGELSATIVHHHIVAPVSLTYYEAYLEIPASLEGTAGTYMPVLYVNDADAITPGREIWGFPKFRADIRIAEEGGEIRASVQRDGATLIDISVRPGDPLAQIPETPAVPIFNVKLIPSVVKGAPPDVLQITATTPGNPKFTELRPGVGKVTLSSTPVDPLGSIPVLGIVSAASYVYDFTLDYGKVTYDYLAKGGTGNGR